MVPTPQSHACPVFTGAVYVEGCDIVLRGEAVFAKNSAGFGGTTVKYSRVFPITDRFPENIVPRAIDGSSYSIKIIYPYKRVIHLRGRCSKYFTGISTFRDLFNDGVRDLELHARLLRNRSCLRR